MTIVLEIEEGQPFYTQHTISGAEHWVIAPIGCDPETGFNYVVHVALTLVAGYGPETRELIFMLVESDPADPHVEERWYLAGNETKSILPNQYDRRKTRALVFSCIEVLIREVQPETVFMTPTGSNLPAKALDKYVEICRLFEIRGYIAGEVDVFGGCRQWIMQKRSG